MFGLGYYRIDDQGGQLISLLVPPVEWLYQERIDLSFSNEVLWSLHEARMTLECWLPTAVGQYAGELESIVLMQRAMNG